MNISVIIPHYKVWKLTFHCIYQILQNKGSHNVQIIVVDNNDGDGSVNNLAVFRDSIKIVQYPKGKLQSHGIAIDYAMPYVLTDWFITLESDSYPTNSGWLDYYEKLINEGYDAAGSVLTLSGGTYMHPCGSLYKKGIWEQAKKYCDRTPYMYFPNMAVKDGFDSHLMVYDSVLPSFLENPEQYITLSKGYKPYTKGLATDKAIHYLPTNGPFHSGMGSNDESVLDYNLRDLFHGPLEILIDRKEKIIHRVGMEPGQWFCYWMMAQGFKLVDIPTGTYWLPGRENQQQEYTISESGVWHGWGGTAYSEGDIPEGLDDVYSAKRKMVEELYSQIPANIDQ